MSEFNKGLKSGIAAMEVTRKEVDELRQKYYDENQYLTDMLLATEDKLHLVKSELKKLLEAL